MAINNPQSIAFSSLPEKIKDWLSSEQIGGAISEINQEIKGGREQLKIISRLILKLAVQQLNPRDFINELSGQLKISRQAAEGLAKKLTEKTLKPIEADLRQMGVDISYIFDFTAPPAAAVPVPANKPTPNPPENLPFVPPNISPAPADKPFILHQEKETANSGKHAYNRPSVEYQIPLREKEPAAPQIKAEVEGLTRVVHYNNFYSPFNQSQQKIIIPKSRWFS